MSNEKFQGIAISKQAYQWLVEEKKRTKLSIKVIIDSALIQLSCSRKKASERFTDPDL